MVRRHTDLFFEGVAEVAVGGVAHPSGELVGVGVLIQNHFNGEVENNAILLALMRKYGLPSSPEELNIEKTDEVFEAYYDAICKSSAIESDEEAERFRESLKYLRRLGR